MYLSNFLIVIILSFCIISSICKIIYNKDQEKNHDKKRLKNRMEQIKKQENKKEEKAMKAFGMTIDKLKTISLGKNVTIQRVKNYYYQSSYPYYPSYRQYYPQQPFPPSQQTSYYYVTYMLNLNGLQPVNVSTWLNWINNKNPGLFDQYHPICFQKIYLIDQNNVFSITINYYFNNYYYDGSSSSSGLSFVVNPLIMLQELSNDKITYNTGYVPMYNKQNAIIWNNQTFCTTLLY